MYFHKFNSKDIKKGFTLIELLIVIAILGVLAAAVLVAVDPLEQLARGRDSGRKTTVSQIGHALQSYYTVQTTLPAVDAAWITTLSAAGELKTAPPTNTPAPTCAAGHGAQAGYCYHSSGTEAVVYTLAESKTEKIRATGGAACTTTTWVVFSTVDGAKTGVYCNAVAPSAGTVLGANLR